MANQITNTISAHRFKTYLTATNHDHERALKLYIWNATLGAAFHLPIQAVEVGLRNRIHDALITEFGHMWWQDKRFLGVAGHKQARDIRICIARVRSRGQNIDSDRIVSGVSFGFWVEILNHKFFPDLWSKHLYTAFPSLPRTENRQSLYTLVTDIAAFRNRIAHREPIFRSNALQRYSDVMRLMAWICPDTALWVRPHCDVPKVVRLKP